MNLFSGGSYPPNNLALTIHVHGHHIMGSDKVKEVFELCDFMVHASGVEGMAGAVLNSMKNGVIPLVTPVAALDEMDNYGYVMRDSDYSSVGDAVKWAAELSDEDIIKRKSNCVIYVSDNHNIELYEMQLRDYFTRIM